MSTEKTYSIVWNSDRTEGVVTDDQMETFAMANGYFDLRSCSSSLLGEFWTHYGDGELHLEQVFASSGPGDDNWRPIDTAPRTGEHILLFTSEGISIEGWWIEGTPDLPDEMGHDAGWVSVGFGTHPGRSFGNPEYYRGPIDPPTHWQPLPQPPESEW